MLYERRKVVAVVLIAQAIRDPPVIQAALRDHHPDTLSGYSARKNSLPSFPRNTPQRELIPCLPVGEQASSPVWDFPLPRPTGSPRA